MLGVAVLAARGARRANDGDVEPELGRARRYLEGVNALAANLLGVKITRKDGNMEPRSRCQGL